MKNVQWVLVAIVLVLFLVAPVSALSFMGSKYMGSIPAGGSGSHQITLGIGADEKPVDMTIEVMGFGQRMDKGYTTLAAKDDTSPYSARKFISLDKNQIHLEPGVPQQITATISLPQNVGSGGRYATIYIYAVPKEGQTLTTAVIVPVLVTISGTTPNMAGSISGVDVGEVTAGQPLTVTTTFKNTGDHHYYNTVNQITLANEGGTIVTNSSTDPSKDAVIPGNTVQYVIRDIKGIQPGTYTITSKILLEDGKVLDQKTTTFTVKSDYVPPMTEASATLSPGKASTLATPDGRYSVAFPQGAVLGDVVVTLKPYSKESLQPAPSTAKLGATCFEISGLAGLLSKDATVSVKYSEDDLTAAGGDASKLKLAYYDAAQNSWIILPTQVNSGSTTLSATTNHLSVWAVMVSSSTTGTSPAAGAPVGTTTQGAPLPLQIVVISLTIGLLAAGYVTGKMNES